MNRPRSVVSFLALFGMMIWISLALESRAADDTKAPGQKKDATEQKKDATPEKGEKKESKSEPSKAGNTKLEGKEAPDFGGDGIGVGEGFSLAEQRGKNTVIVAFFTATHDNDSLDEFHAFHDLMGQFKESGAIIVGVTKGLLSHERSIVRKTTVPVVGDEDGSTCEKYGALQKGKVNRITFVIDQKGIVRKVIDTKDPKKHAKDVLDFVKTMKS